ncbi:xylose isomerase [Rhodospirillum rubrum]|uniref:sugar phosphate isomerase/epimerase family protein n=1 Tax=Rhodospirillum rubrum TaxID=1085 RepID=UPI001906B393|nr:sugar phosphate isomerase/epimerase [Rhodospirillum rubrum]MBK1663399.1 xylose isomerase [Rhodospirillum rubrum]MBK1675571.1 xylose isomerase [Rhodospirillum rubrum]
MPHSVAPVVSQPAALSPPPPKATIGFTLAEGDLDRLDRQLGRIATLGADGVELNLTALGCLVGGRIIGPRLDAIRRLVARRQLAVTVHGVLSMSFMDTDHAPAHHAVAKASVDVAGAFGARTLVVHPAWIETARFAARRDDLMALEQEGLRRMAETAEAHGLIVALENMPPTLESLSGGMTNHGLDPLSIAAQVRAVDHPALRATIDFSHAHIAARHFGWDLTDRLAALAPLTAHLHLHDSLGRVQTMSGLFPGEARVFGEGDLHLPLGWGDAPFEAVLPRLPLAGAITVALEIGLEKHDDATAADSLLRARTYCASAARAVN